MQNSPVDKTQLFHLLIKTYSFEEIKTIAFKLDIDHEILLGQEKQEFARELILYLDRKGKLEMLLDLVYVKTQSQSSGTVLTTPTNMAIRKVQIENPNNILLPIQSIPVLEKMFNRYQRLVIKSKLTTGFSGAHVLVVRPIGTNGAELQTVVKLSSAHEIEQEWDTFQTHIQNKMPQIANIDRPPVYNAERTFGGLRYPFVGGGIFTISSLRNFYEGASLSRFNTLLRDQLFKNLTVLWADRRFVPDHQLRKSYDFWLPPHLTIDCSQASTNPKIQITPETITHHCCQLNDFVTVQNFLVSRVDKTNHEIILDIKPLTPDVTDSYQIRLQAVSNLAAYREGVIMPETVSGVVVKTRQSWLVAQAQKSLPRSIDLRNNTIPLTPEVALPNPIMMLPKLLRKTVDMYIGPIHGDLNLENVLVRFDNYNSDIHLIDFANARQDHLLHDLLCLESGFLVHILPTILTENTTIAAEVSHFLQLLHQKLSCQDEVTVPKAWQKLFNVLVTIRSQAQQILTPSADWETYYNCLAIYLVSMLDFDNLDSEITAPKPKLVAFWGAATLCALLTSAPVFNVTLLERPRPVTEATKKPEPGINKPVTIQANNIINGGSITSSNIGGHGNTINHLQKSQSAGDNHDG